MEDSRKEKQAGGARSGHGAAKVRHSREHEDLLLAKTRLMKDIQTTENPRYREFLETSLAAVEKQLAEID